MSRGGIFAIVIMLGILIIGLFVVVATPSKHTVNSIELMELFPPGSTNVSPVTQYVYSFDFNGDSWYAYVFPDGKVQYRKGGE